MVLFWTSLTVFVGSLVVLVRLHLKGRADKRRSLAEAGTSIAPLRLKRQFLSECGVFFFVVEDGRMKVTDTDGALAAEIEEKLNGISAVRDLLASVQPGSHSVELREALVDQVSIWYEIRINVTRKGDDEFSRTGIIIPIETVKKKEHDLMEMHIHAQNTQERENFVFELTHRIRTPLNAIVGFSQLMSDPDAELDEEETEFYKQTIEENASDLTKIIEDVLAISHLGSHNMVLGRVNINVSELMESVIADNRDALDAAEILVTAEPGNPEVEILADPIVARRVIQNLIENVIYHAASGKTLVYGWIERSVSVDVYVKDAGPGISDADMPFLYKAFYKVDRFSHGAGLGLTVAHDYLEQMNGSIRCESSSGRGATFFINFAKNVAVCFLAFLMLTSCATLDGLKDSCAAHPLWWVLVPAVMAVCTIVDIVYYRKRVEKEKAREIMDRMAEEEVDHTLELLGGHLFRVSDGKIVLTKESAKYLSLDSNILSLDDVASSMDDSDKESFLQLADVGEGRIFETIFSMPNFRTISIMTFSARATKVSDGAHQMILGILYSIDEAHKRMSQMREVFIKEEESKVKQSFLACMSHEIRTPLNAIVGFSKLLIEQADSISPEESQEYSEIINQNNEYLLQLLNSAVTSTKEQDKILKASLHDVELGPLLDEIFKTHNVLVPSHLDFVMEKGEESIYAKITRTGIRQVVSNLINNACKFTKSGSITLGWKADEEKAYIYVKDTGIGIRPEEREEIFRQYFKADSSTKGAGIGLPLCKRLIEMMEGTITVEGEYGRGSTFVISLPRVMNPQIN